MADVEILISGAGIAGLVAAAALAHAGFSVQIVDPAKPQNTDLRSTAYLLPAKELLSEIGLWDALKPHVTPLDALQIIDTQGWPPTPTETRQFSPKDLDQDSFGWNIPNAIARDILIAHLKKQPEIKLDLGIGFAGMLTRTTGAKVRLTDGRSVTARLVIGADGRNSAVRVAAGIREKTIRYGQKALAFHATHTSPHNNVSTEVYNQGGAFTTVPLPDVNGQHCSAIVWMNPGPKTQELAALTDAEFDAEMTMRACNQLGPMSKLGALNPWPVTTQTVERLTAERVVLIAEAAHVLPPIGAQGLNTSLRDIAMLVDIARSAPDDLGAQAQLDLYQKTRAPEITRLANAIDVFNRVCQSGQPMIQALRSTGLRAAHDIAPLRQALMKVGIGRLAR